MDEWTEPRKEDIDCRCERGHCENMHYMWRVCGDQRIYGARSSHPIFTKLWKHRRWPAMGDYYWFSLECSHPCDSDMINKKKLAQWYPFSIEYRALVITLALIFIPNIADRRIYMWIQSLCGAQFLWWLKIGRKKKHNVRMWFALLFASGFVLPKAIIQWPMRCDASTDFFCLFVIFFLIGRSRVFLMALTRVVLECINIRNVLPNAQR